MRGFSWLNVVLIGLVVLLIALLIDGNRPSRVAIAQDAQPGAAGGVIAVTGTYIQDGDVLYVVDTNQKTVLVYAFARPSSGAGRSFDRGVFQLLAGRSYEWDTLAASKVTIGRSKGATPAETKKEYLKHRGD